MITGMTIGAGVLGLPYAVSRLGLLTGIGLIVFLGLITLGLNLMIGEVAVAAGENLQLPGLAGKFIGSWAKWMVSLTLILRSYGALLAYVVGEGLALSALFGNTAFSWSVIFWVCGSALIASGLQRITKAEKVLSFTVMTVIVGLSAYLLKGFHMSASPVINYHSLLLSVGVMLFALSASPAVAEAHALLSDRPHTFRGAVLIGTCVPVLIYVLFVTAVVGVSGSATTPIATMGLSAQFGPGLLFFGNLFAVLAMSTGFMGLGTALKETFQWDYKISPYVATLMVVAVPLILFLAGVTNFIKILEVVGGLFISLEAIVMVLVYSRMRKHVHQTIAADNVTLLTFIALPIALFFVGMVLVTMYYFFKL